MTSYRSTLRRMNPNKTRKVGDDVTAAVPLAERMRLLELNALWLHMDHEICEEA